MASLGKKHAHWLYREKKNILILCMHCVNLFYGTMLYDDDDDVMSVKLTNKT